MKSEEVEQNKKDYDVTFRNEMLREHRWPDLGPDTKHPGIMKLSEED